MAPGPPHPFPGHSRVWTGSVTLPLFAPDAHRGRSSDCDRLSSSPAPFPGWRMGFQVGEGSAASRTLEDCGVRPAGPPWGGLRRFPPTPKRGHGQRQDQQRFSRGGGDESLIDAWAAPAWGCPQGHDSQQSPRPGLPPLPVAGWWLVVSLHRHTLGPRSLPRGAGLGRLCPQERMLRQDRPRANIWDPTSGRQEGSQGPWAGAPLMAEEPCGPQALGRGPRCVWTRTGRDAEKRAPRHTRL